MLYRRSLRSAAYLAALVLVVVAGLLPSAADASPRPPQTPAESFSRYVAMPDGVRLAVEVYLPPDSPADAEFPVLLELTRYWRAREDAATGAPLPSLRPVQRFFLDHGYALAVVDARGTGASFGSRTTEYGDQEVRDAHAVVDWIVAQPWADGNVGAYGTSYTGTTAELLAAVNHPAVKAVIPGWSDWDVYTSPVRPYGMLASGFIRTWSDFVGFQDDNAREQLGASVRRVDGDDDGSLLAAAVAEHAANPEVYEVAAWSEFRDSEFEGIRFFDVGPQKWVREIERSQVPMLVLVSWLDAGTIDGTLQRLARLSNPQKVVVMATSHGGFSHASPFMVSDQPVAPQPAVQEQMQLRVDFFDHHLRGADNGVPDWPTLRYWTLGEEAFHDADGWPPVPTEMQRWYPARDGRLNPEPGAAGEDEYSVDFGVTTGTTNRWTTQMGGLVLDLDDRGAMDARMLTYTTAPLEDDLEVTGAPVVTLRVRSDHADGAFFAYLEDVDPEGRSRYITEGGLRAIHRAEEGTRFPGEPLHGFREADAEPLVPGEWTTLRFRLWPTSVLFRRGHRIRLAIAGADADTFDRVPAQGTPTITLARGADGSVLELPVAPRR